MASLKPLWGQGHLAPVLNVGPLAAPLTKAQYIEAGPNSPLVPDNLFSHSDQQRAWEGASTDALARTGWGARTAETLATPNPVISFGGNCRFGIGEQGFALALPGPGGSFAAMGLRPDDLTQLANQKRKAAVDALYAPARPATWPRPSPPCSAVLSRPPTAFPRWWPAARAIAACPARSTTPSPT
jgi:uncharacterized protein (DUF1501 family)